MKERLGALGGRVTRDLPVAGAVAATVPAAALARLAADPAVRAVTPDAPLRFGPAPAAARSTAATPAATPKGVEGRASVFRSVVGAEKLRAKGVTGKGVTVAVIDTGVADLPDLRDRIVPVNGRQCQNFSGETGCGDGFGHGTFMAGLIAGGGAASKGRYTGVAPGARILSVKVGGRDGSADVSKLLAAIQWVVAYRARYGIKVLNLSVGTDSGTSWRSDPLNYAVERAWQAGITVVVSAGNFGPGRATIAKPADDPWVLTVGATDDRGTAGLGDDLLPDFSSRGPAPDQVAKPDLAAPGAWVVSLRSPGSTIEREFPGTGAYRRGSGTSMSAAVTSGAVALLLQARPGWAPNRVKFALTSTARRAASSDRAAVGAGVPDASAAIAAKPGSANAGLATSSGLGALDASRGSMRVKGGGLAVTGAVTAQSLAGTLQLVTWNPAGFLYPTVPAPRPAWTEATWPPTLFNVCRFLPTTWSGDFGGKNWHGASSYGQAESAADYGTPAGWSGLFGTWG
jgi:serine protease AprX